MASGLKCQSRRSLSSSMRCVSDPRKRRNPSRALMFLLWEICKATAASMFCSTEGFVRSVNAPHLQKTQGRKGVAREKGVLIGKDLGLKKHERRFHVDGACHVVPDNRHGSIICDRTGNDVVPNSLVGVFAIKGDELQPCSVGPVETKRGELACGGFVKLVGGYERPARSSSMRLEPCPADRLAFIGGGVKAGAEIHARLATMMCGFSTTTLLPRYGFTSALLGCAGASGIVLGAKRASSRLGGFGCRVSPCVAATAPFGGAEQGGCGRKSNMVRHGRSGAGLRKANVARKENRYEACVFGS